LIGIASSGLHSNGFSLVRKICFDMLNLDLDTHLPELGKTLGEELLTPTKIYVDTIQSMIKNLPVLGLSHITGGGFEDNITRVIPNACSIVLHKRSWEVPPVFAFLQKNGKIKDHEMMRTFNNGLGLVAIVPEKAVQDVLERLNVLGERAYVIGEIVERKDGEDRLKWS
jgi:phosphoribosylformylglycinamidine cyclo-ligase